VVRVLTVDDHEPFLEVARDLVLATPGFESAGEVASGVDALAAIEASDPDLVLVDIHMPGMTGIEMTRRMRDEHAGPRPVVVLISAQDLAQLPAAAHTCGAAEVISKQDLGPTRLREIWRAHGAGGATDEA
jgi:two-component system, NarL family, invasion response regulator UvrY